MTWAKLDDSFHSHPKVRGAWYRCPAAIGLHVIGITYAADHETDGIVPLWFVAGLFQKPREMESAVDTLTELGMWEREADDFVIHDFLDYHPSKAEKAEKRAEEAGRKKREREERKRREEEEDAAGVSE
jgi:hypothetical protein